MILTGVLTPEKRLVITSLTGEWGSSLKHFGNLMVTTQWSSTCARYFAKHPEASECSPLSRDWSAVFMIKRRHQPQRWLCVTSSCPHKLSWERVTAEQLRTNYPNRDIWDTLQGIPSLSSKAGLSNPPWPSLTQQWDQKLKEELGWWNWKGICR